MTIAQQKRDMINRVIQMPADGITRLIPTHAMRGMHCSATAMRVESAYAEIAPGVAIRSMCKKGKWTQIDEIAFDEFGKVELNKCGH